jgi:hypothetical protein
MSRTDPRDCPRYRLGRCDGTRHLVVCGCGAVGAETCQGKRQTAEMPRCCTEAAPEPSTREEAF